MDMDIFQETVERNFKSSTRISPLLRLFKLGFDWKVSASQYVFRSWYYYEGKQYGLAVDYYHDIQNPATILDSIKRKMSMLVQQLEVGIQRILEGPSKAAKKENASHDWHEAQVPEGYQEVCYNCKLERNWEKDDHYPLQQKGKWFYSGVNKACPTLKGLAEEVEKRLNQNRTQ